WIVDFIGSARGQEVASHTSSHYYSLEPGQDVDAFREDLVSARKIFAKRSLSPGSLVFPRNQVNIEYLPTAAKLGFRCYRGHGRGWIGRRCEAYPPRRRHRLL